MIPDEELENLQIDLETKELIRSGRWTIDRVARGYIIRTEPYSQCCNPKGQTEFYLNEQGNVVGSYHTGKQDET